MLLCSSLDLHPPILQRYIGMVIHIMILLTLKARGMRQVFELKTQTLQSFFFCFSNRHCFFFQQVAEYAMVFPKRIIDVPEKIIRHSLQLIIKAVAAIIITEFFVYPSADRSLALPAMPVVQAHVLIDHNKDFSSPKLAMLYYSPNGIKRNLNAYLPANGCCSVHFCEVKFTSLVELSNRSAYMVDKK